MAASFPRSEADMELGTCVPNDWVLRAAPSAQLTSGPNSGASASLGGIMFGLESPDHSRGVYLFRLYPINGAFQDPTLSASDVVAGTAYEGIKYLIEQHTLPSDITQASDPTTTDLPPAALNNDYGQRVFFRSAQSQVTAIVGAAKTSDNAVIIGIVYGPDDAFNATNSVLIQVFLAFSSF